MIIKTKIISSLTRIFTDSDIDTVKSLHGISALNGEVLSLQLASELLLEDGDDPYRPYKRFELRLSGPLAKYAKVWSVDNVAVELPYIPDVSDDHFERTAPGLYPDVLSPLHHRGQITVKARVPSATWIELTLPEQMAEVGVSVLTVELIADDGAVAAAETVRINVIDAALPEQTLIYTDWFHCDGLASYYGVDVWSEEHWQIVENFARAARKNGINMLLTPTFTPPLDTAVGGERLTTQLVGVTAEDGKYSFDFTLLDRWIDMCDRIGIKYLEIAHLFTQWGAKHAPKVMATVDGEYKRIFGWETDAVSGEYVTFLRQYLSELLVHLKARGDDRRCMFHISDEPEEAHAESYRMAKTAVADILEGYPIMDALSSFEFYKSGIVDMPIPVNDHIQPFIDAGVPDLWTYYCCGQSKGVSNRLVAMPASRNRSIGMQMYKYDIVGFLHWGYNFYNSQFSDDDIIPYINLSADHWVPAGDAFSVYPGHRGEPLESPRLKVFYEGVQDMRAMQLCEKYYTRAEIVAEIEKILGTPLTFSVCAYDADTMLAIREKINNMIAAAI